MTLIEWMKYYYIDKIEIDLENKSDITFYYAGDGTNEPFMARESPQEGIFITDLYDALGYSSG